MDNDHLPLIYQENQNAQIAVKTSHGISKRVNISNIVMQGSVWGSLMCVATMDKLGKIAYNNEDIIYRYRGIVPTPPMQMIDDINIPTKCSSVESITSNQMVNSFMLLKKLSLNQKNVTTFTLEKII